MLKLFEEAADLKQQFEVLGSLAGIYFKAKDEQKLAEMLKKRLEISEQFGDREVRLQALSENLPNSPIYQLIKNRDIKSPVDIYKEMLEIHQNSFDEFTKREIQARRTRLGAGTLNEIKLQVEMEGIVESPIDDLYRKLLNLDLDLQERISLSSQFFKFAKRKILHVNDKRDLREILQNLKEFLLDSNHFTIEVCRMELEENNEKWENLSLDRIKPFFEDIKTEDKALYSMITGYRLMRDENWDEALEEISFGLESDAENIFGNRLLYITYSHLDNWDSTIQSAEFFQKIFVSFQQLYEVSLEIVAKECEFTLACAYANIGETGVTQAITMLKSILNSDPERIDVLLKLSQVLLTIPKPTDAIRYLENILAQDCNNDAAICELGWAHYLSNHLESAKECLLRAQGIRETYLTHYRLARVYWSMGGTYLSDRNYSHMNLVEAIKMNPNYSHSFTYLGHFYSSVDSDIERASKCYSKSISINPNDADAVESIVNIWISQGKVKESIDLLHQFAKFNTRSGWAWKQLGILVFSDKNYTESVSYFQADLRINPKDAHSWTLLAEAYTQQGKYIAALKAINKAIEVEPNNITAYFIRGTINTKLNLYSDATADFIFSRDAFFDQSQNLVAVTKSLGESLISEAIEFYENGAYGACFENLLKAVSECKLVLRSSQSKNGDILKIIGDACVLIVKLVCNHIDEKLTFPIQETINLLERMYENQLMILELLENHHISWKCKILQCAILCFNLCIVESQQTNLPVLSRLYLDLANVHHLLLLVSDNTSLKDEMFNSAVKFCKQSLAADPENIESWSLMGLLNYKSEPALSQHCFIQALSLDESVNLY
jgi:tetratricopeptide (TPR) repeat protein